MDIEGTQLLIKAVYKQLTVHTNSSGLTRKYKQTHNHSLICCYPPDGNNSATTGQRLRFYKGFCTGVWKDTDK